MIVLCEVAIDRRAGDAFYALNYGIDQNNCPSLDFVKQQLTTIKPYTSRIKTFSVTACNQGDLVLQATQSLGLRIHLGIWVSADVNTFQAEQAKLIELAHAHSFNNVDGVIVGSETQYRGDVSPETLADMISQVKQSLAAAGVNVPVATADVYYKLDPVIVAQVDFVMMNAFPYWEGVAVENAVSTLFEHYDYMKSLAGDKPVLIGETGWPTRGANFGAAVPSISNQETFLKGVLCQVRQRNIQMCYFEGQDELYKADDVERSWGFLDSNGNLKASQYSNIFNSPC
ncbi:glycoside hydrolase 3 protein [Umbelopsis sp. WA50703]